MKRTLGTHDIVDALMRDEYAGWSYEGAKALAEWLEELEEDCGAEYELDTVALRCEYNEYESALDAYCTHNGMVELLAQKVLGAEDAEEAEEEALNWLDDRTVVIRHDKGVIIQAF